MIRIEKNEELAEIHYNFLSPKLEKRIEKILNEDIVKKNTYIRDCLLYITDNLKRIIIGDITELQEIIKFFERRYPFSIKEKKVNKNVLYEKLYNIFIDNGYDKYLCEVYNDKKEEKDYHSYEFVKKLGIKTCPYCNRSYISYVKNEKKQTRPQIDHYYPKSIFPFIACSFYNLIPSCSACNHMKRDDNSYEDEKSNKLINPYNVEDKDFKFSYTLNDLKIMEIFNKKDITFEYESSINITLETKYEKNDEYFQLKEIYQNHKDIVIELILKEINYPQSYIKELINNDFGTKEEIYRFLFSNYLKLNDLHKRPLSKLTKDIVEELGIIDKIELLLTNT
jgi:hypothetical protein